MINLNECTEWVATCIPFYCTYKAYPINRGIIAEFKETKEKLYEMALIEFNKKEDEASDITALGPLLETLGARRWEIFKRDCQMCWLPGALVFIIAKIALTITRFKKSPDEEKVDTLENLIKSNRKKIDRLKQEFQERGRELYAKYKLEDPLWKRCFNEYNPEVPRFIYGLMQEDGWDERWASQMTKDMKKIIEFMKGLSPHNKAVEEMDPDAMEKELNFLVGLPKRINGLEKLKKLLASSSAI